MENAGRLQDCDNFRLKVRTCNSVFLTVSIECIAQSAPILKEDMSIDYFEIRLLPALPHSMSSGKIEGMCLRGGFRLNMCWKNGIVENYNLDNTRNNKYIIVLTVGEKK